MQSYRLPELLVAVVKEIGNLSGMPKTSDLGFPGACGLPTVSRLKLMYAETLSLNAVCSANIET